ncbi:hypothetical protein ACUN7Z_00420 [Vreelandella venusta]|uniref:hypothetical protein n=1 Tax=Vreelandella venusta TaxID=44935 RepID=UPI0040449518
MAIEATIDQYRATKEAMQSIIDRHMQAALIEIEKELGDTPTSVSIDIIEEANIGDKYPKGCYAGCAVGLGGE